MKTQQMTLDLDTANAELQAIAHDRLAALREAIGVEGSPSEIDPLIWEALDLPDRVALASDEGEPSPLAIDMEEGEPCPVCDYCGEIDHDAGDCWSCDL